MAITYTPPPGSSGPGGASPEEVREIMSETLVGGDGIEITSVNDTLEVTSIVGVTTVVRPWAPADLLYATEFSSVPAWHSQVLSGQATTPNAPVAMLVTGTNGSAKPAYTTCIALPIPSGGSGAGQAEHRLSLQQIPEVAGQTVTRVKFYWSFQRSNSNGSNGIIAYDAITLRTPAQPSLGAATPWAAEDVTANIDVLKFTSVKAGPGAVVTTTGFFVTGLEIYGVPTPWMLNDVAAYQGKLWRSMQDNNPNTPGTGPSWQDLS